MAYDQRLSPTSAYIVQSDQRLRPAAFMIADGEEQSFPGHGGQQLLDEERQQNGTDHGEIQVVNHEEPGELHGFSVSHELPSPEGDGIVGDDAGHRRRQGRKGRLALGEAEVLRMMAYHGPVGFVENGPQMDPERSIEGGRGESEQVGPVRCHG